MMTKHFLPHIGEMVNKLLKYLYLEFDIIIAYILQNISKIVKLYIKTQ